MLSAPQEALDAINSPVRTITAKVELYNGSTLVSTYTQSDSLQSIEIERLGEEGKFFGFGITQKVKINLRDNERAINITNAHTLKIFFGVLGKHINPYDKFHVTEVNRDENTNNLTVIGYCSLKNTTNHTVSELQLGDTYSYFDMLDECARLIGVSGVVLVAEESSNDLYNMVHDTTLTIGSNLDGTETIRELLNAIAEVTQSIYYCFGNALYLKRLCTFSTVDLTIDKSQYMQLDSGDNYRLAAICHATELGDNVTATFDDNGVTQYVRNNPFYELRDDIGTQLERAVNKAGGMEINQFSCEWRGNFLLEMGDKIALITKDNNTIYSYVINDVISYNGGMNQKTQWSYNVEDTETASNPSTLGDALKETFAKVDKANKEIALLAGATEENAQAIASIQLDTETITSTVQRIDEETKSGINGLNNTINELNTQIQQTTSEIQLSINKIQQTEVDHVTTSTGFTFNQDGLTVSKSDSEITTQITENGMTVRKNTEAVLTADSKGVKAVDLEATTYLIVGKNSRFEDFGSSRTACFWVGK